MREKDMLLEGIQTEKRKIRSNAGDKATVVDAEKALDAVFDNNYRIRLDHFCPGDKNALSQHKGS